MAIVSKIPANAEVLDLAAARAARAEARAADGKGTPFLKLSAGYVEVQPEIPVAAAFLFQEEKIKEGLALILVDQADIDILWPILTQDDLAALVNFVTGKSVGESQA